MMPQRRLFLQMAVGAAALPALSRVAIAQSLSDAAGGCRRDFLPAVRSTWSPFDGSMAVGELGTPFVIENRAGAGGNIAAEAVPGGRGFLPGGLRPPGAVARRGACLAFVMLFNSAGVRSGLINIGYGMTNAMIHNTSWVTAHFHLIFGGSAVIMYSQDLEDDCSAAEPFFGRWFPGALRIAAASSGAFLARAGFLARRFLLFSVQFLGHRQRPHLGIVPPCPRPPAVDRLGLTNNPRIKHCRASQSALGAIWGVACPSAGRRRHDAGKYREPQVGALFPVPLS